PAVVVNDLPHLGRQEYAIEVESTERARQQRNLLAGRRVPIDDDAPLAFDLAQAALAQRIAAQHVVADPHTQLVGGPLQLIHDLIGFHGLDFFLAMGLTWVAPRPVGRYTTNVEPRPTAERTSTRPPCRSTMFLTIDRPRPV